MKKLLSALLFAASTASAHATNGNFLLSAIESGSWVDKGFAVGYIGGIFDTTRGQLHCAPSEVTYGQARDLIHQVLKQVPEYRHLSAEFIITTSLAATYPCGKPI
jgi:hypothetical protein